MNPGPEAIKLFSMPCQLSMKFFLLINVKMPTIVGILTFMSRKNSILSLSEPAKCWISWYFHTYEHLKFHAQLSWVWKKFYNLGAWQISSKFCNLKWSCCYTRFVWNLVVVVVMSPSHNEVPPELQRNGSMAAVPGAVRPPVCEIWVSTPCFERIAWRSHDRIYHPNCSAKCLIRCLSDAPLPFQIG